MLFGRVTDFNVRNGLKAAANIKPAIPLTQTAEFKELDHLVSFEFHRSLPPGYKCCLGAGEQHDSNRVDTDLFLVHLLPHASVRLSDPSV